MKFSGEIYSDFIYFLLRASIEQQMSTYTPPARNAKTQPLLKDNNQMMNQMGMFGQHDSFNSNQQFQGYNQTSPTNPYGQPQQQPPQPQQSAFQQPINTDPWGANSNSPFGQPQTNPVSQAAPRTVSSTSQQNTQPVAFDPWGNAPVANQASTTTIPTSTSGGADAFYALPPATANDQNNDPFNLGNLNDPLPVMPANPTPYGADSSNKPSCKALYDFEPEQPGELRFKTGDMIELTKKIDENWYEGKLNGNSGFFPINYVQVITPLP